MTSRVTRQTHKSGGVMLQLDDKGRAPEVQGRDKRLPPVPLDEDRSDPGPNSDQSMDTAVTTAPSKEMTTPGSAQTMAVGSSRTAVPGSEQKTTHDLTHTTASGSAPAKAPGPEQDTAAGSAEATAPEVASSKTTDKKRRGGPRSNASQSKAAGGGEADSTNSASGPAAKRKSKNVVSEPKTSEQPSTKTKKASTSAQVKRETASEQGAPTVAAPVQGAVNSAEITPPARLALSAVDEDVPPASRADVTVAPRAPDNARPPPVTASVKKLPLFLVDPDSPTPADASARPSDKANLLDGAQSVAPKRPTGRRRADSAPTPSSYTAARTDDRHGERQPRESDIKMLTREEMRKQIVEAVMEAEAEDGEVDEDGAPMEPDTSKPAHARGPMSDSQKKRIAEVTEQYLKAVADLAREFNRSESAVLAEAKIALKLSKKPSTYNRYTQWWCATHSHEDEDGEQLTLPELRKLWLADYNKDVRNASPEDRAKLEAILTKWEEAFAANNAERVKKEGNLYKMMLRIREDFTTLAAYYYRLFDVVVAGFVVSSRPGDAHAMQANCVFAPTTPLVKLFSGSNLVASMGELGALATTQRVADIQLNDFSKEREDWICDLTDQKLFKQVVQKIMRLVQSEAWGIPERPQVMWTKSLMQNVRKRIVIVGWTPLLPPPDTKKRMLSNTMLCKELVRAFFAARRGETSGVQRLGFRPMTSVELGYRDSTKTRANWMQVPIWIDSEGITVKTVADAHAEVAAEGVKTEGSDVKLEHMFDAGGVPDDQDDLSLSIEDDPPAKPAKRKRAIAVDIEDDPPAKPTKRKRAPDGQKASGTAAAGSGNAGADTSRGNKKRKVEVGDDEALNEEQPTKKPRQKSATSLLSKGKKTANPKPRAPSRAKRPGSQRKNPFSRDPARPRKPGKYMEIDNASGEELQLDSEGEHDEEEPAASSSDEEAQSSASASRAGSAQPSPLPPPQGADQVGGGNIGDSLDSLLNHVFTQPELPYEDSFVHALETGTAVGLHAGTSGMDFDAFLDRETPTMYPTEAAFQASMDARLFDWGASQHASLDAAEFASLYDVNMGSGYMSVTGPDVVTVPHGLDGLHSPALNADAQPALNGAAQPALNAAAPPAPPATNAPPLPSLHSAPEPALNSAPQPPLNADAQHAINNAPVPALKAAPPVPPAANSPPVPALDSTPGPVPPAVNTPPLRTLNPADPSAPDAAAPPTDGVPQPALSAAALHSALNGAPPSSLNSAPPPALNGVPPPALNTLNAMLPAALNAADPPAPDAAAPQAPPVLAGVPKPAHGAAALQPVFTNAPSPALNSASPPAAGTPPPALNGAAPPALNAAAPPTPPVLAGVPKPAHGAAALQPVLTNAPSPALNSAAPLAAGTPPPALNTLDATLLPTLDSRAPPPGSIAPRPVPSPSSGASLRDPRPAALYGAVDKEQLLQLFSPEELAAAFALVLQGRAEKQATGDTANAGA